MAHGTNSTNDYFESLFKKSRQNTLLIMTTNGIVISINAAFTECFGYGDGDIVGKSARLLFTEDDQKEGMLEKELKTVLRDGQAFDNNYLVNKDKTVTWVSGESLLVKHDDGSLTILKVIQNIHKRKVSELALRHLNDFNESILGSIEDVVIVLDEKMNVIKANNAFTNLFKNSLPELSSFIFPDLIKAYDKNHDLFRAIQKAISTRIPFSNKQIEIETPAGERIFDVSCNPMQSAGDTKVLLIIHDITIFKQLEREREDVMGFVAHELRNPLSNIILCNEVMSEAIKDLDLDVIADMLDRNKNNVARLQRMIAELYEATIVNSGYMPLEISTFNFNDMVKEAIDTVEVLQSANNIVVVGNEGNIIIQGDRHRLIQVITNYLSNGIKYSNSRSNVTLTIQQDENYLIISVNDQGLGISKEQLPYVFERFFRVEKTRNIEGIGLGLYLCRQIIHAHKGHVWVESEEGKGSTFYFSIPLNK